MAKKTPAQVQQDAQDYDAAYDEDMPQPVEQTDDEAFGLVPDVVTEEDDYPSSPDEAEIAEPEPVAETVSEPVVDDMAKEVQRLKSWEGRLKAMEAQLKSSKASDDSKEVSDEAIDGMEEPLPATDLDGALKALSADFGEDFTKMLMAVIDAKVSKANEGVAKSVDEIISDIVDTKAKAHFETIADKHPDFMEIADSKEFADYLNSMPEADMEKAKQIVDGGTAREINNLLSTYKATRTEPQPEEPVSDESMDAAEGVRSTGMRLPTQPAASSDYADAWNEFKD